MSGTIEVDRKELAWALRAALPHAGRDKILPQLMGVHLDIDPHAKTLFCVATDRYTMGCARVRIEAGDHTPIGFTLATADVRDLLRRVVPGDGLARLTAWPDEVMLDDFFRYRPIANPVPGSRYMDFPSWRKLLGPMLRKPPSLPGKDRAWNPGYLARFATARKDVPGVVLMPQRNSAVVLGADFAGAITPARVDGDQGPAALRSWREAIPAEVTS